MNLDNLIGAQVVVKGIKGKLLLVSRLGGMSIYKVGNLKFPEWKVVSLYLNHDNDITIRTFGDILIELTESEV